MRQGKQFRNGDGAVLNTLMQVEQFIESIFPTQDIKKLEAEKKLTDRQEPGMDTSEAVFLIVAVVGVLLLIGGLMVCFCSPLLRYEPADLNF